MSDKKFELSRRRVLAGLGTIGVASAGAGAGTMALFSDEETSSGNTVQAGTLDLTPGDSDLAALDIPNAAPGDSDGKTITVTNSGTIGGSLDVGLGTADVTTASPEPQQATTHVRTFTCGTGLSNHTGEDPYSLSELGLSEAVLELDLQGVPSGGSGSVDVTLELPKDFANTNDNAAVSFDRNNSGTVDFHIKRQDGGWVYKEVQNGSWTTLSSSPAYVSNETKSGTTISFTVQVDDPFAIGGEIRYASESPPTTGSNVLINLTPNFGWDTSSAHYVEIERGTLRNLGEMLDLTLSVAGQKVITGKANRIDQRHFDINESLPANGGSASVTLDYELGHCVGNAVQNESVSIPINLELNQEDSQ